ncbi:metallophosphoesterase [Massilibacteroides sp.]|uniref:metallophosphoesterase n=1 Tax=Massilibacteroides sp. TaxID=2034766 RepID=UPI00261F6654|nr:metallophosphoesterase [Massilibacteroides sp.]MDD4514186.1 metallophosphoesterase [Massilibacteroides sp.]
MKVFFQSIVAQLLLNPYILVRGYQALPPKKSCRIPYVLFFIIELLLFFTGYFFHDQLPDDLFITIMYICNTWYVASLYITLSLLFLELLRLSQRFWKWFPDWLIANYQKIKIVLFFFIPLGVSLLLVDGYRRVAYPVVKHVHLTIPKDVPGRDSLRVVMMSDLHIGEVIGKKIVQRYVALSNQEKPDMVVLVGDIMDYESRFAEKAHIEEDLQQLQAPLGTYVVYGNHEYRANRNAKYKWLKKTGATLLIDSVAMPDSTFYLIGRDDYINKNRKPLRALVKDLDPSKPSIVLDHQPWAFAETAMNKIDLALHGHTHNGQLWPYPLLLKAVYEKAYGYYRKGDTQYYVSSGIGIAGPPYRVGTVSELIVLHIQFKKP